MSTQTMPVGSEDALEVRQVGGDLTLQGWDRSELQARGDQPRIEKSDQSIVVSSSGDLVISVPRGMRIAVRAIGGDVRLEDLSGSLELGVTGGDAQLRNLSGSVRLTGPIGGQIRMENVSNISMGPAGAGGDYDMGDRIRRQIAHATRRAEKSLYKAQAKLQHFESGRWKYNSGPDVSPSSEPVEPVSEQERMTILRMLQEKKITSEQAEKLLSALEGNG